MDFYKSPMDLLLVASFRIAGICTCGDVKETDGWIPCNQCYKYYHCACSCGTSCSANFVCNECLCTGHSKPHTPPILAFSAVQDPVPKVYVKRSIDWHCVATIGNGVVVKPSLIHAAGLGLFANGRQYTLRQQITEYAGSLLASKLDASRKSIQTHLLHLSSSFHNQLGNDIYIDGDRVPIYGRGGGSFANHSPKSMCNAKFAIIAGKAFLVATADISDGDEIYVHCGSDLEVMMGLKKRKVVLDVDGRQSICTVCVE